MHRITNLSSVNPPGSREQADDVQLVFCVQADASIFQESDLVTHGLLPLLRTVELHDGPFQILHADIWHILERLDACRRVDQPVKVRLDMTWEEITDLLTELAEQFDTKVNINRMAGLETVMLHLVPVAYFCSMKFTGELTIGTYEGEENRLVGKENLPLAELTPEFVRQRVGGAAREWLVQHMDFEVVSEMIGNLSMEKLSRHPLRDVHGVSEGEQ